MHDVTISRYGETNSGARPRFSGGYDRNNGLPVPRYQAFPQQVAVLYGWTTSDLDSFAVAHCGYGLFQVYEHRSCLFTLLLCGARLIR